MGSSDRSSGGPDGGATLSAGKGEADTTTPDPTKAVGCLLLPATCQSRPRNRTRYPEMSGTGDVVTTPESPILGTPGTCLQWAVVPSAHPASMPDATTKESRNRPSRGITTVQTRRARVRFQRRLTPALRELLRQPSPRRSVATHLGSFGAEVPLRGPRPAHNDNVAARGLADPQGVHGTAGRAGTLSAVGGCSGVRLAVG
jgi:hypothetical protein